VARPQWCVIRDDQGRPAAGRSSRSGSRPRTFGLAGILSAVARAVLNSWMSIMHDSPSKVDYTILAG